MTDHPDTLLGPIKAIIAEELPEYYVAEIDLSFDKLCEGQEDNFKVIINLSWDEKATSLEKAKEDAGLMDWNYRITERIRQRYPGDGLLISLRLPACRI
jgi:hypothetical protein